MRKNKLKETNKVKLIKVFEINRNYLVYIFQNDFEDTLELYLQHKKYGVMKYLFGVIDNNKIDEFEELLKTYNFNFEIENYESEWC